jgi:hypothetical protein
VIEAARNPLVTRHASWFFIVAHPGHELRVHHVLELTRPIVAVMTDGSGSTGASRLDETRDLLSKVGAQPATVFGAMADGDAYRLLMQSNPRPFNVFADRLAAQIDASGATAVVIDAAEGYHPLHDVCHWMGRAALARLSRPGRAVQAFELNVIGHPDQTGPGMCIDLDEDAVARKMTAMNHYRALAAEAAGGVDTFGADAFRVEFLRSLTHASLPPATWVPSYEQVGEARVASGRYDSVLRFAAHVRPVLASLAREGEPAIRSPRPRTHRLEV